MSSRSRRSRDGDDDSGMSQNRSSAQLSQWSDAQQEVKPQRKERRPSDPSRQDEERTNQLDAKQARRREGEARKSQESGHSNPQEEGMAAQRSMAQLSKWSDIQADLKTTESTGQTQQAHPSRAKARVDAPRPVEDEGGGMTQQRSMAQLSKWSDSQTEKPKEKERVVKEVISNAKLSNVAPPQPQKPIAPAPKSKGGDDDYDDDFEDYDEDFEEETPKPQPPKAVEKPPPKAAASSKISVPTPQKADDLSLKDIAQLQKSIEMENSEALLRRQAKGVSGGNEQKKR